MKANKRRLITFAAAVGLMLSVVMGFAVDASAASTTAVKPTTGDVPMTNGVVWCRNCAS